MIDRDRMLKEFLGPPQRGADQSFAETLRLQVLAEERLRAARRAAWAKFGREALANGTVVLLLVVLNLRPDLLAPDSVSPMFSPMTILLFLFGVWTTAFLRSSSRLI